ncbi:hypothetical protein AHAS_Ahas18G0206500 [Arachis hypogaea]
MGYGALSHIPSLNVADNLLMEQARSFDLYKIFLNTQYGNIKIIPTKIRDVVGLNANGKFLCYYF